MGLAFGDMDISKMDFWRADTIHDMHIRCIDMLLSKKGNTIFMDKVCHTFETVELEYRFLRCWDIGNMHIIY